MVVGPMSDRLMHLEPMFRALLVTALDQAGANIQSQGAFTGEAWAEMALFTQVKPPSMGGPRDPSTLLYEKGILWHITLPGAPNGQTITVDDSGGSAGINRPAPRGSWNVAKLQQEGTKKIPARPFFGWWDSQKPEYERVIYNYFVGADFEL
jgi:hypothetical protein